MMAASRATHGDCVSLSDLLRDIVELPAESERAIRGLASDSRAVRPGDLFFAVRGSALDGGRFLKAAAAAGAVAAVVRQLPTESPNGLPLIVVPDVRAVIGVIADRFFRHPSQGLRVIGITGTNGKTSCCHFLAQLDDGCAVIGTRGTGFLDRLQPGSLTTPDPISLHRLFADLAGAGARAVAMEASSHALSQQRVAGVRFDTAVFTGLGQDHLDYHGSPAAYAEAKASLFEAPGLRAAVLKADDPLSERIRGRLSKDILCLSYGIGCGDVAGLIRGQDTEGTLIDVGYRGERVTLRTRLLGRPNVENVLAVVTVRLLAGASLAESMTRLDQLRPVPGRMQLVSRRGMPLVAIDYAHNPQGLESALLTLREHFADRLKNGRVWCVFGCGGDRDAGKRPVMGEIATRLADRVVITTDNPRGEDPRAIAADILAGSPDADRPGVQLDRALAISQTLVQAAPDDVILVAGKGDETHQLVRDERRPFSDLSTVMRSFARAEVSG